MFWTDVAQAQERIGGTVICYDKTPVVVEAVESKTRTIITNLKEGKREVVSLEDEKWNDFRDLPKLGWFNAIVATGVSPMFIHRRSINSRNHGLTGANTQYFSFGNEGLVRDRYFTLLDIFRNKGYHETMSSEELYPKVSDILMSIGPNLQGAAFSSKFCVSSSDEGMKWLYRLNKRVGFFSGSDSLNLFPNLGYLKEEIQACPSFDINNIREF